MWSWHVTYLPTSVRGVWLYLYLVIDVWSRACLRERICKGRPQPLILHADNGNA